MDMAPSAPDPALADPTDPHRERAERHGRVLARLADLTLGLAEAVQGQAVESTRRPPEDAADRTRGLGLVFARLPVLPHAARRAGLEPVAGRALGDRGERAPAVALCPA
jgi:hypothetical protein